jgi:hypothetical protein
MAEPQPGAPAQAPGWPPPAPPKGDGRAPDDPGSSGGRDRWLPVPRAAGQPIAAVVTEERGVARVRAFARRWRALRYHREERQRPWLSTHDLCGPACTGLTSRCLQAMVREGFLSPLPQKQR